MTTTTEYPVPFTVALSTVLLLENLFGVVMNVSVLLLFHVNKKSLDSQSNAFITSLNILDILVCLTTVPMTTAIILSSRSQTKLFCYFHEASISLASSASATNLLFISLDRYDVVLYPFNRHLNEKTTKYIVALIWVISWFGFLTPFYGYGFSDTDETNETETLLPCAKWFHISRVNNYYYEIYYVVIYIISNTVMIICYWQIFRQSKNRLQIRNTLVSFMQVQNQQHPFTRHQLNHDTALAKGRIENEKKLTKVSMAIVISFMLCWGPHAILSIVLVCISEHTITLEMLQLSFLSLAYLSAVTHPLLYAFMRKSFRQALSQKLRSRSGSKIAPLHPILGSRRFSVSADENGFGSSRLSMRRATISAPPSRDFLDELDRDSPRTLQTLQIPTIQYSRRPRSRGSRLDVKSMKSRSNSLTVPTIPMRKSSLPELTEISRTNTMDINPGVVIHVDTLDDTNSERTT